MLRPTNSVNLLCLSRSVSVSVPAVSIVYSVNGSVRMWIFRFMTFGSSEIFIIRKTIADGETIVEAISTFSSSS